MYLNGGSVIAIGIIFPVLGTVAVLSRFYTRIRYNIGLGIDDWLCVPALIILIATGAVYITGSAEHLFGYHSPQQTDAEAVQGQSAAQSLLVKLENVIDIMNPIGTGFVRLSFLFLYRRIFRGKVFDIVSWTMIAVVIAWALAFFIANLGACGTHISALWTSVEVLHEYCFNTLTFLGLLGITSFVLDCFILSIPFFWIWPLHMKRSQKIAVSSVFLCGIFALCAGALRMTANIKILTYKWGVNDEILGLHIHNDTYGLISMFLFWQYIEQGTGLIVCCLPTLRPLFKNRSLKDVPRGMSTTTSSAPLYPNSRIVQSVQTSTRVSTESLPQKDQILVTRTIDQERVARPDAVFDTTTLVGNRNRDEWQTTAFGANSIP